MCIFSVHFQKIFCRYYPLSTIFLQFHPTIIELNLSLEFKAATSHFISRSCFWTAFTQLRGDLFSYVTVKFLALYLNPCSITFFWTKFLKSSIYIVPSIFDVHISHRNSWKQFQTNADPPLCLTTKVTPSHKKNWYSKVNSLSVKCKHNWKIQQLA
jgi:hypothetical protein